MLLFPHVLYYIYYSMTKKEILCQECYKNHISQHCNLVFRQKLFHFPYLLYHRISLEIVLSKLLYIEFSQVLNGSPQITR